ncbi:phospholipid phosphatase-related protein type 1 isoform X1 [Mobula hypostoma]|uniref:phospholipid phosphatase-related protein type 1 isoform X1 n=1 Tax=Mobula hypostoma TaxID=723540 RepID=UPI002FC34FD6
MRMATEVNNIQRSYSIIPCFIFVELVIMAGTVLLAYYFECTDTFEVHVQGFFCQDADLMKPYPGPEEDSFIPPIVLYCVLAAVPTIVIFIGEISMYFIKSTRENLLRQEKTIVTGECCYLSPLFRRIIRFIGVFAFGLFATDIFVNAGQVVTGSLTPYFITVCKPNYTGTDCRSRSRFLTNEHICTGNPEVIAYARRSFPSKDASLSIYCALYATMYITSTIKTKSSRLAKPVLCLGALCAAFLTGLNRVSEYRNHCSDVIAGFVLGSTVALFLGICVVHNFKGTQTTSVKQKPKDPHGVPLMTFPRVESPLETLSAQQGGRHQQPPREGVFRPRVIFQDQPDTQVNRRTTLLQ